MRKEQVPQDQWIREGWRLVSYATDDDGRYEQVLTEGWEPVHKANEQAWELIREQMTDALEQVKAGKVSTLAFYMAAAQMDVTLVSQYVRLPRWRVRRHLKPEIFQKLKPSMLDRYAKALNITRQELLTTPERV